MLQSWVCRRPMRDADKSRLRLSDRRTIIDQLISGNLGWRGMDYGERLTVGNLTSSNVHVLHCIVGPYIFIFYIMFHLNVGDDKDNVYA